jgi:hypothetical protein
MTAQCGEHDNCPVRYIVRISVGTRGSVGEAIHTCHSSLLRVVRSDAQNPVTARTCQAVREALGSGASVRLTRPVDVQRALVATPNAYPPGEFVRRVRRRVLRGQADETVVDETPLRRWCERRFVNLSAPESWPTDTTGISVFLIDIRGRSLALAFGAIRFVEFWIEEALRQGDLQSLLAMVDFTHELVFREYTVGQLTLPAWRQRVVPEGLWRWKRLGLPAMYVMSPTEDGNHYAIMLQWSKTLIRAVLSRRGLPSPEPFWYQINGDWVKSLIRVAKDEGAIHVVDLEHLYRHIWGRDDVLPTRAATVVHYCYHTAYMPYWAHFSAFWSVKLARMSRAWESPSFVNWVEKSVLQQVRRSVVDAEIDAQPIRALVSAPVGGPAAVRARAWTARWWCGMTSRVRKGHPASQNLPENGFGWLKYNLKVLGKHADEVKFFEALEQQTRVWCSVRGETHTMINQTVKHAIAPLPVRSPSADLLRGRGRAVCRQGTRMVHPTAEFIVRAKSREPSAVIDVQGISVMRRWKTSITQWTVCPRDAACIARMASARRDPTAVLAAWRHADARIVILDDQGEENIDFERYKHFYWNLTAVTGSAEGLTLSCWCQVWVDEGSCAHTLAKYQWDPGSPYQPLDPALCAGKTPFGSALAASVGERARHCGRMRGRRRGNGPLDGEPEAIDDENSEHEVPSGANSIVATDVDSVLLPRDSVANLRSAFAASDQRRTASACWLFCLATDPMTTPRLRVALVTEHTTHEGGVVDTAVGMGQLAEFMLENETLSLFGWCLACPSTRLAVATVADLERFWLLHERMATGRDLLMMISWRQGIERAAGLRMYGLKRDQREELRLRSGRVDGQLVSVEEFLVDVPARFHILEPYVLPVRRRGAWVEPAVLARQTSAPSIQPVIASTVGQVGRDILGILRQRAQLPGGRDEQVGVWLADYVPPGGLTTWARLREVAREALITLARERLVLATKPRRDSPVTEWTARIRGRDERNV